MHEQNGDGGVARTGVSPRSRGQRQYVGNVAFAIAGIQGHRNAFDADRRIPVACSKKYLVQRLLGADVMRSELPPVRAEHGPLAQQRMPAGIGVDDASGCVDEQHAVPDAVESIGKCRGFGGPQIYHPADQHRAANVRHDDPHASSHLVVDSTVPLMPEHTEHGGARRCLVERNIQYIDYALRFSPFSIGARFEKFVIVDDVRNRDRLFDFGEEVADRERIELDDFLEVELLVLRIDAGVIRDMPRLAGGVLGKERSRRAADELRTLGKHADPQPWVERRVVDLADEKGEPLVFPHRGHSIKESEYPLLWQHGYRATENTKKNPSPNVRLGTRKAHRNVSAEYLGRDGELSFDQKAEKRRCPERSFVTRRPVSRVAS